MTFLIQKGNDIFLETFSLMADVASLWMLRYSFCSNVTVVQHPIKVHINMLGKVFQMGEKFNLWVFYLFEWVLFLCFAVK